MPVAFFDKWIIQYKNNLNFFIIFEFESVVPEISVCKVTNKLFRFIILIKYRFLVNILIVKKTCSKNSK